MCSSVWFGPGTRPSCRTCACTDPEPRSLPVQLSHRTDCPCRRTDSADRRDRAAREAAHDDGSDAEAGQRIAVVAAVEELQLRRDRPLVVFEVEDQRCRRRRLVRTGRRFDDARNRAERHVVAGEIEQRLRRCVEVRVRDAVRLRSRPRSRYRTCRTARSGCSTGSRPRTRS